MTTDATTHTDDTLAITPSEQLTLALGTTPAPVRPLARQVPPQLRLDARTRQVGRAGIAQLRRILAESSAGATADRAQAA